MKNRVSPPTAAGKLTNRRSLRRLLRSRTLAPLLALVALSVTATPALASSGYEDVTKSFVSEKGAGNGEFKEPTSVAVNDETGDVYVLDKGNDRVEWFSAEGAKFEGQFNGSKTPALSFLDPEGIAVDNDPSSESYGDVYVADVGHEVIDKFSAIGKYEGQTTGGCQTAEEIPPSCNGYAAFTKQLDIAVDTSGDLWVFEANAAKVYEFSATGSFSEKFETNEAGEPPATGFAVDSNGDLYARASGLGRIDKFNKGNGARFGILTESASSLATLAINPSTNGVLVDEGSFIERFSQSEIERHGPSETDTPLQTFAAGELAESYGIAVNGADNTLYASERGVDKVEAWVIPTEPPKVVSQSAVNVSLRQANFSAVVEPGNSPTATTYAVEYSTEGSVVGNTLMGSIKRSEGESTIPAGAFEPQSVVMEERPLPNVEDTYYYRVVVSNECEPVANPGHECTTYGKVQAYTKLPIVESESTHGLTLTDAILESKINPNYQETSYEFEYAEGTNAGKALLENGEGTKVPGESQIGEEQTTPVTVSLTDLEPDTTYYYRVIAENASTENASNANMGVPVAGKIEQFVTRTTPLVSTGSVQNITRTTATLSGAVTPRFVNASYYFAYISEVGYRAALAEGASDPYADGETTTPIALEAGESPQAVGPIAATGLLPGETYRYALVSKNYFGTSYGEDHAFTTLSGTPPLVSTGGVSAVSQNAATLSGTVSTNSLQTNYGFEIGTGAGGGPIDYGPATGLGSIGGAATEEVHVTLGELEPGTTYYYRVTATNADGTVQGQPGTFTTPGFPTLVTTPTAPPLVAYTSPGFPTGSLANTGTGAEVKTLTNAEKLSKALKACHAKKGKKRSSCEAAAHKRYAPASKKKGATKKK